MAWGKTIRGLGMGQDISKRKVKIYDVSKQELILECESMLDAARFCGVPVGVVAACVKRKIRCHKNALNKTITFR